LVLIVVQIQSCLGIVKIMKFALANDERIEASKGTKGVCPCCSSELVARCGEIKVHHWAHKKKCDDHWWENETKWHRNWKNQFPKEWQEIIQKDESGEKHIADVKTSEDWVIEFQHSAINKEERNSRDSFYNKLIWIVDGMRRKTDLKQFQSMLNASNFIYYDPLLVNVDTEGWRLPLEWEDSNSIIFIDFGDSLVSYRDGYSSNTDLWLIYRNIKGVFVSHLSRNSFIEMFNNSNSDEIFNKLINPIQNQINKI
jgi:competence protein CoiA